MGSELGCLGLYGLLVIVTIILQAEAGRFQLGLTALLKPRDDMPKLTGLAGRLERAQLNSAVALALFAPAVLILAQKGISTPSTLLAAQVFLIARLLYVPFYAFGLFGIRTLVWLVAILATAWLYLVGLGVV